MNKFASALAVKPLFNHTNKTITVSDKFMKEAVKPFTNEFNDLMELRKLCPDYKVITRSHRSPRKTEKSKNIRKYVSYDHMEKYIKLLPNSESLLLQLKAVKEYGKAHNYPSSYVFKWFNDSFPDYHKNPVIDANGKLVATVKVVRIEDVRKELESKKKAELPQAADPQDTEGNNEGKKAV